MDTTEIKIGDLVTSYKRGYWKVTGIRKRWRNISKDTDYAQKAYCIIDNYDPLICGEEMNSLIDMEQIYNGDGGKVKPKKYTCDSSFCIPAQQYIEKEIERLSTIIEQLKLVK